MIQTGRIKFSNIRKGCHIFSSNFCEINKCGNTRKLNENPKRIGNHGVFSSSGYNQNEYFRRGSFSKVVTLLAGLGISLIAIVKTKKLALKTHCEERGAPDQNKSDSRDRSLKLSETILKARDLLQRIKDETGSPGLVVGVSVNGEDVWKEGLGYADVENRTPCTEDTVFRIASISKAITMGLVAKLWENGDLDLDRPIQHYLPNFPIKYFDGEKVDITTRQLVSHLAGIRHYDKDYIKSKNKISENKSEKKTKELSQETKDQNTESDKTKDTKTEAGKKKSEFENKEYYIKRHFNSVTDSLTLFQNDPLVHKPGSKFLYTTHGWTIISAVMEKVASKPFDKLMEEYFINLGLQHTYLEQNDPLVYHRGRHYVKNNKGRTVNAPYVDNSYKWAGGGFLSDVTDLLKFGNIMLYSYQSGTSTGNIPKGDNLKEDQPKDDISESSKNTKNSASNEKTDENKDVSGKQKSESCDEDKVLPGYLKRKTMDMIFSPVENTGCSWDKDGSYGMGWAVIPEKYEHGFCKQQRHYVSHTGGAIGASSVLLILPSQNNGKNIMSNYVGEKYGKQLVPPQGIVVALVANVGSVNLNSVALEIAKMFELISLPS